MARATTGVVTAVVLVLVLLMLVPVGASAQSTTLVVTQQSAYRHGILLVVDAVVQNVSPATVDAAQVSVEFTDFFDDLVSAEHAILWPSRLLPGQVATVRVATPWSDAVRIVRYRFTWFDGAVQRQTVVRTRLS